eukprot:9464344-Alexandrium_andersonii.AAC.1
MSASLVGSEMCIRDSKRAQTRRKSEPLRARHASKGKNRRSAEPQEQNPYRNGALAAALAALA